MPSDQTAVKNVLCDETNPQFDSSKLENTPGRGRLARSVSRSRKRSQSAVPYRRNSVSASRSTSQDLPCVKITRN